jgi:hypothetical protein
MANSEGIALSGEKAMVCLSGAEFVGVSGFLIFSELGRGFG